MNAAAESPANDQLQHPLTRAEFWSVLALTLIGATVRCAFPSAMAIEHFDEGVYASNLLFPDQGFKYPDRHLYAPSLVPALIEWSIILFGTGNWVPMLPSLLFGTLTIPLMWWVGRSWFGPATGLAAASLVAFSDYHILLSRSALTDVTLGFWLLLAVFFFENAFRTLLPARALIAGVVTGFAWWTKYNGWLPMAIVLSGLLARSIFARQDERQFRHRLCLFGIGAATAVAVWSPFWLSLPNGYSQVSANHRQYIVGFDGWLAACFSHITTQLYCFRGSSALSVLAAIMLAYRFGPRWNQTPVSRAWIDKQHQSVRKPSDPATVAIPFPLTLAEWLLIAWFCGMSLATPIYRPYPRLLMPWMVAAWLGFVWFCRCGSRFEHVRLPKWLAILVIVLAYVLVFVMELLPAPDITANKLVLGWQPRTGLAFGSMKLRGRIRYEVEKLNTKDVGGKQAIVYVLAEPGLFFHLPADELAVGPIGNLDFLRAETPPSALPTFLVTGPHADRMPAFHEQFAKYSDRLQLVEQWPYAASDFVLLDQVPPRDLDAERAKCEVRLYLVRDPR